jgi:hypothetical protein
VSPLTPRFSMSLSFTDASQGNCRHPRTCDKTSFVGITPDTIVSRYIINATDVLKKEGKKVQYNRNYSGTALVLKQQFMINTSIIDNYYNYKLDEIENTERERRAFLICSPHDHSLQFIPYICRFLIARDSSTC